MHTYNIQTLVAWLHNPDPTVSIEFCHHNKISALVEPAGKQRAKSYYSQHTDNREI